MGFRWIRYWFFRNYFDYSGDLFCFSFYSEQKKKLSSQNRFADYSPSSYQQPETYSAAAQGPDQDVAVGISKIQSLDQTLDPLAFKDRVQDLFFKIQATWGKSGFGSGQPFSYRSNERDF